MMTKHFVYMEPELWKLLRRLSLANGCKSHPEAGSASEASRRYLKKVLVERDKGIVNLKGIDWDEKYI